MPDLLSRYRAPGTGPTAGTGCRYHLHGLGVEVLGHDPAALTRVHAVLQQMGLPRAGPAPWRPGVTLRFSTSTRVVARPPEMRPVAEHAGIRIWRAGADIHLECAGHASRLDLAAGTANLVIQASGARLRPDLVIYTLLLLLGRRGLYGLHASAVARDGAGCLFVGVGGSSKSTQTYSLVRQGWDYLGDDSLLLRSCAGAIEALALRRDLCLHPSAARVFPEVAIHGNDGPLAGKGKRQLAMRALHPDRLIDRCTPSLLVFPTIVPDARSRLVPLGRADALVRLLGQSAAVVRESERGALLPLDSVGVGSHMNVLGRLARQARGYRLLAGRDLMEDPGLIAPLLSEALDRQRTAASPSE